MPRLHIDYTHAAEVINRNSEKPNEAYVAVSRIRIEDNERVNHTLVGYWKDGDDDYNDELMKKAHRLADEQNLRMLAMGINNWFANPDLYDEDGLRYLEREW
jgi:hypothetical protein